MFDQLTRIVAHGVLDEDLHVGRIRSRVLWSLGMAEMRLAYIDNNRMCVVKLAFLWRRAYRRPSA